MIEGRMEVSCPMEVKEWSYEEYPSFDTPTEGVVRIPPSGDENGTYIYSNVEY